MAIIKIVSDHQGNSDPLAISATEILSKYLIVHADDLGLDIEVNRAICSLFDTGAISSTSVMVPCRAFANAAQAIAAHPEWDVGIHLTLTSEWPSQRLRPVTDSKYVGSLVGPDGYLFPDRRTLVAAARPEEVIIECLSQIEMAKKAGIHPTHLDSHMLVLFKTRSLYDALAEVASQVSLPYLSIGGERSFPAGRHAILAKRFQTFYQLIPRVPVEKWLAAYLFVIAAAKPGANHLIVHPGFDTPELRLLTGDIGPWGAAWRQRDFDALDSREFREAIERASIKKIGWRNLTELAARMDRPNRQHG
jgi:predicted glycoside hydrolase/deacetylase ChbG (UPF0249 family)